MSGITKNILRSGVLAACMWPSSPAFAQEKQAVLDENGVYHLPEIAVPPSPLTSEEYRQKLIGQGKAAAAARADGKPLPRLDLSTTEAILKVRAQADAARKKIAQDMLKAFPVTVTPRMIAGVQTDVVEPKAGITARNKDRVLINLHGGGMMFGARWEGQVASIPIAGLGGYKVITVDYRMAPEYRYPSAEEDVVKVYRELLRTYRPENIGIYGHSAGAYLTGSSVAHILHQGVARPGAISFDGGGAAGVLGGDSKYLAGAFLFGVPSYPPSKSDTVAKLGLYASTADPSDPLRGAADHPKIIRKFPPTLIMNATRDPTLSNGLYTHRQLVNAGVETELHVWDGLPHSFHYDESLPESRESYQVLIKFFDKHLGTQPR